MNPLKLSIVVAVAGLFASAGTVAADGDFSSPSYTYVFAATPNPDDPLASVLDGSTITIQDGAITTWALIDTYYFGYVFTPADSSLLSETIISYNASTWTGTFQVWFNSKDEEYYFQGDNSSSGGDLDFSPAGDPAGTWTGVPDALNSLQLLALALAGLAAAQLFLRRPVAVLARN